MALDRPSIVILAGPNGAGKSNAAPVLRASQFFHAVNTCGNLSRGPAFLDRRCETMLNNAIFAAPR